MTKWLRWGIRVTFLIVAFPFFLFFIFIGVFIWAFDRDTPLTEHIRNYMELWKP